MYTWNLRFCSFHERRADRHARHVREQVGNSMNILCLSVIDLHSMWSWKLMEAPSLVANIHFARKFIRDLKSKASIHGLADDGHDEGQSKRRLEGHASPVPPTKRLKGKQPDPAGAELAVNMKSVPGLAQAQLSNLMNGALSSSPCTETPVEPEEICTKSETTAACAPRFALLNQIRRQMNQRG